MQGGLYDPVPPSSIPLLSRRMRAFSGMPRDFQAGRQATKLWTEACQPEFESAPSCGEAKRTPIRLAALRGSRISETRETTKGSAELKFRIQSSPAEKSDANSLFGAYHRFRSVGRFWASASLRKTARTRRVQVMAPMVTLRTVWATTSDLRAGHRRTDTETVVHAVLDNYATHKHPKVLAWLSRHPRWVFHFTPTSASWLNAVENFFSKMTRQRIRRGVFHSIVDLQSAINAYLAKGAVPRGKGIVRPHGSACRHAPARYASRTSRALPFASSAQGVPVISSVQRR